MLLSAVLFVLVGAIVYVAVENGKKETKDGPLVIENSDDVLSRLPKVDPVKVEKPAEKVEGTMVLTFKPGTSEVEKKAYIDSIGATIEENLGALNSVVVKVDEDKITESDVLAKSENDYYVTSLSDPSPDAQDQQAQAEELSVEDQVKQTAEEQEEDVQESLEDPTEIEGINTVEDADPGKPLNESEKEKTSYEQDPVVFVNKVDPEDEPPLFNDLKFTDQWALEFMGLSEILSEKLAIENGFQTRIVAVIDSGVCIDHPELKGKLVDGYDYIENDNVAQDEMGHGCAVAGIIAANSNNKDGIVGAAPGAKIMPLRVLDAQGLGTYSNVAAAIVYAVDHGADIINISIGGNQNSELLKSAVDYAHSKNIPVVASTGNTSSDTMLYPAKYESVMSVGSINSDLFVSKFSSHNKETDYFAPGESIVSLNIDGSTKLFTGTSFATPYITSLLANGMISDLAEHDKGFVTASGVIMPVSFEQSSDAEGWGTTDYDPADVRTDVQEEFLTAQSTTKCVTRYSQGWWNGAQCYVEGIWDYNSNPSYSYQVYDSGYKYNFNMSGGATYLTHAVRVELTYTGQYSYSINSVTITNRSPIGDFNDVTDAAVAWGWAFDPDSPSTSIAVHIYIDGPAGDPDADGFSVPTNVNRSDVNSAYGISGTHGFSWLVPAPYNAGTHTFYVYGINAQGGSNPQLSHSPTSRTFSVLQYNPSSSNIKNISINISKYGYFLPAGFNADVLSEANQNISYIAHEMPEDPVNTATGFLDYSAIDLKYADIGGKAFEFGRTYNSDSSYSGILGVGWQASFDMKIVPSITNGKYGWTVIFPDGHGEIFYDNDNNFRSFEGTFTAASTESKGNLYRYGSDGTPNPYVLIYVDSQSGQQFFFRSDNAAGNLYGKMVQIQYPNGMKVTYNYDANGKILSAVEQTFNRKFDFTLDTSNRLTKIKDAGNREVNYTYNANGRLWKVTNPVSGVTEYLYNANNRIESVKDPNNATIATYTYGTDGKVTERTDGNGKTTSYAYTTEGNNKVTTITDPLGHAIVHKHNDKDYLVEKIEPNLDSTTYTYDDKGNRLSERLPDGKLYQFTYDENGNRTKSIYPNDYQVTTEYNSKGKPVRIMDGVNVDRSKSFSYDSNGNLVSSTDANGKSSFYEYDSNQLLKSMTEASDYSKWSDVFGTNQNWDNTKTVRTTGDVNGDGKEDLVAFGMDNIEVALSDGTKFQTPQIWYSTNFTYNKGGWRVERHPRMLADVNGDGKDDIVGFANSAVMVALSNGSSFTGYTNWISNFGYSYSWRVEYHPRVVADVNNDHKADVIGFADNGPRVALSTGSSFGTINLWYSGYGYITGGWQVSKHPRTIADVNGDGKGDVVGFSDSATYVSLSTGSSFGTAKNWLTGYNYNAGWDVNLHPRIVKDINNDGKADIVGFADPEVRASISDGTKFAPPMILGRDFGTLNSISGQAVWSTANYIRTTVDLNNDGVAELIGFAGDGVYVLNFNGNKKTYNYTNGYLVKEIDQGTNAIIEYANDPVGNRTRTTDAELNITNATYNGLGKKLTETDARNNSKQYFYDTAGYLDHEIDEDGVLTEYTYDGNYNVTQIKVNNEKITQYQYDYAGNKTKEISPEGNYTETDYDENDRATEVRSYDKEGVLLATTSTTYNPNGSKASETDANNVATIYNYDPLGRLFSESKAGKTKTYAHDFWGNLISESDWEGHVYEYTYDKLDRKTVSKNPVDILESKPGTRYEYDVVGNVVKITDSFDQVTTQTFDSQKRLKSVKNPKGQTATYTYFKNGKLREQINFAGEKTSFTYDPNGNLYTKKDNLDHITAFEYDQRNLNTKITDAENNDTTLAYDQYKNNIRITNDLSYAKIFTYDLNGNMLTSKDEENNVTTYAYDGLNRKVSEMKNRAVNSTVTEVTETFTYDANGNMETHIDGRGKTTGYDYDAFNRMTKVTNPDNTEKNFVFDGDGNMTSSVDEKGAQTQYFYDQMKHKTKEIDPENHSTEYSYDVLGRLTSEKDAKGQTTTYSYDVLGNVIKVTDRDSKETTLTYDAGNRVKSVTYPNGLVLTNEYDGLGRKFSETKSGTGLTSPIAESYTYDNVGNVLTEIDPENNLTTNNFDSIYRLTSVNKPMGLILSNSYDHKGNLLTTTDEKGATTTYEYDPQGSVIKQKDALNFETVYKYDANGNLSKVTDANGNDTSFVYDDMNRKLETKGPDGQLLEKLEYDPAGNVIKQYDGNDNVTTFTYHLNDKVKNVKDPYNNTTAYEYDGNGNVTRLTNKLGKDVAYTYSPMDKLTQKTDEMGYIWGYTYDSVGNMLSVTDPKNRVSTNEYDVLSRKTKTIINGGEAGNEETSYQYDKNGNLTKTIDPRGNALTNTYDALGRNTRTVNDQSEANEFTYDGVGNILTTKDAENNVTTYTYDLLNRKTSAKDSQNQITAYTYDHVGNLQFVTKPNSNQERYNYDNLNRVVEYIDGESNKTVYTYDNNGNTLTEKRPNGTIYSYAYDQLNRNIQKNATAPGEGQIPVTQQVISYDAMDRVTGTIDAMSHTTNFVYDDLGRLKTVTDSLNGATTYTYDEVGNLSSEKNANLNTTTYEYDVFDNMVKETDPLSKFWSYEFDKNGNITKETDAKGQVNVREYDKANRLTAKKYLDGETIQPESMYFEYDSNGNMTKAYKKNSDGTVSIQNNFTFDNRYSITNTSDNRNYSQSYEYDNNGNLAQLTFADGKEESYTYNGNDRIASLTASYTGDSVTANDPKILTTNFSYDVNGNLVKQANPDRSVVKKSYNYLDQVTEVNNYKSTSDPDQPEYILAKYNYTLNANGQKTQTDFYSNCDKTNQCASNIEVSTHDNYVYDALGRLTHTQRTIDNPTATIEKYAYNNTYTYDAVGNRTSLITNEGGGNITIGYTYNANNQLLTEASEASTWNYTYDDNGNRLTKTNNSTTEYVNNAWDRANNLTQVESKLKNEDGTLENYKVNYTYDALNRRTSRTPDSSVANDSYNNITKQNYVYDKNSWDMNSEYTDRTEGTDVHTNYYMAQLGMGVPSLIASEDVQERTPNSDPSTWERVADESSSELDPEHNFIVTPDSVQKFAYYQRDALDSIVSRTNLEVRYKASDSTGTFVLDPTVNIINIYKVNSQNRTDEYGKRLNNSVTTPESGENNELITEWSTRGYSGQVYDIESATYYYGSRNYDPQNGTWTKQDSYRGETKNPLSRNRYAFVEEDPVNNIDKHGYSLSGLRRGLGSVGRTINSAGRTIGSAVRCAKHLGRCIGKPLNEVITKVREATSEVSRCLRDLKACGQRVGKGLVSLLGNKSIWCLMNPKKCAGAASQTVVHIVNQITAPVRKITVSVSKIITDPPTPSEVKDTIKELAAAGMDNLATIMEYRESLKYQVSRGLASLGGDLAIGLVNGATYAVEYAPFFNPAFALAYIASDSLGFNKNNDGVSQWMNFWSDTREGWNEIHNEYERNIGVGWWKDNSKYTNRSVFCNAITGVCHIQDLFRKDTPLEERVYIGGNLAIEALMAYDLGNSLSKGIKGVGKTSDDVGEITINEGKQGKHIVGHNNYQPGKSELTYRNPQELLEKFVGKGTRYGNKEVVDFGKNIGIYVDPISGTRMPTTRGTIHYDSKGTAHIVPAKPN